jgi:hypothetical protein
MNTFGELSRIGGRFGASNLEIPTGADQNINIQEIDRARMLEN